MGESFCVPECRLETYSICKYNMLIMKRPDRRYSHAQGSKSGTNKG